MSLKVFEGFLMKFNIPLDILPMAILRPISGTATLAIMNDIFINYGDHVSRFVRG